MNRFPILKGHDRTPYTIPWALIAPHERQALRNHDQTLKRLAERGGLCWSEALAVLNDRPWFRTDTEAGEPKARAAVAAMVRSFEASA